MNDWDRNPFSSLDDSGDKEEGQLPPTSSSVNAGTKKTKLSRKKRIQLKKERNMLNIPEHNNPLKSS